MTRFWLVVITPTRSTFWLPDTPSFAVWSVRRRFVLQRAALFSANRQVLQIPRSYGDSFPRFIRNLGNTACIEYVADVAELECCDGKPSTPHTAVGTPLSSLWAERLSELRIFLHPSVCLVQSRFPIVTIWENNRTDDGDGMVERWIAEAAVVARPFRQSRSPSPFVRRLCFSLRTLRRKNCGNGRRDRNRSLPNSMWPPI